MAAFKIPLAKVVLYLAVSDQFTSFMTACEATHLHCPKFWFMIITNGRELEVNPKLLPTAFPEAVRKPVAHKWTCTSNKCPAFLSVSVVKNRFQISFLHGSSNELPFPQFQIKTHKCKNLVPIKIRRGWFIISLEMPQG
jgi:hypothetical protein